MKLEILDRLSRHEKNYLFIKVGLHTATKVREKSSFSLISLLFTLKVLRDQQKKKIGKIEGVFCLSLA